MVITHVPPNSGCPSSRLSIGSSQVTFILSSLVYRPENHSWSSFSIRTSVQAQCVMFFSRASLGQCLLSDVVLMAIIVLLWMWTWIAVLRSFGPVTEFACAGVSRAVSVRVHTLAQMFAVEERGICLIETDFWHHRIVATLACLPACCTKEAPECRCTPLFVQPNLTSIRVLLHSRVPSLLVCTRSNLLLPAPILALCWLSSGVAPLAASLS